MRPAFTPAPAERAIRTNIRALRDLYPDSTVYVVASGASLDRVPRSFFEDKITVVCNEAYRDWPTRFAFAHHAECCQEAIDRGLSVVTADYHCGVSAWGETLLDGHYYTYHHAEQPHTAGVDIAPIRDGLDDTLVTCSATAASAIHFAAHLGARTIVLCGVDCGAIDGRWNYEGYNAGHGTEPNHVRATERLLLDVVGAIRDRGIFVCSLSPFVGLVPAVEGHVFTR